MDDTLEQRVKDVEDLIADISHLVGLRLESITASQHEFTARIGLLDKQMSMLLRDMRDLRGGVTRQLVEQDKRLAAIEKGLGALKAEIDDRLGALETKIDGQSATFEKRHASLDSKIDQILARLPKK